LTDQDVAKGGDEDQALDGPMSRLELTQRRYSWHPSLVKGSSLVSHP
jgi:hypothetical protein